MPYHPKVLPALVFAVGSLVSPWAAAQLGETFWRPLVTEHQWVDLAQPRLIDGVAVALNGPQYVRYGADKRWVYRTMQGAFTCNNNMFNAFNDPAPGTLKYCQVFKPIPAVRADNDTQRRWNEAAIDLSAAHAVTKGGGVKIAVIDTGHSDHPDLAGKWARDASKAGSPIVQYRAVTPGNGVPIPSIDSLKGYYTSARDDLAVSHGVHVAGVIARVCPDCKLMPVKVDIKSAYEVAQGVRWAIANGAQVINMSFQSPRKCGAPLTPQDDPYFPALEQDIAEARARGIVLVASAGNWGALSLSGSPAVNQQDVANIFPASCPGVLSVGAVDRRAMKAVITHDATDKMGYTNQGPSLSLMAPGGGIEARLGYGHDMPNTKVGDPPVKALPYTSGVWGAFHNPNPQGGCSKELIQTYADADIGSRVIQAPYTTPLAPTAFRATDPLESVQGVYSTWTVRKPGNDTSAAAYEHCYRYLSGTSMAAPHVAGTAGLMLAAKGGLSGADVFSILTNPVNASPVGGYNCAEQNLVTGSWENVCGAGLLNAGKAVNMALNWNTKSGPCAAAPAGSVCKLDALAYDTGGNVNVSAEAVIAYGRLWAYDAQGSVKLNGVPLASVPRYANGPCAKAPAGQPCQIDSLSIIHYPNIGYIESVSAYGHYFNFDKAGNPYPTASNFDLRIEPRYYSAGPSWGGSFTRPCNTIPADQPCKFDTRTIVDAPEWGGVIESITMSGRYFLYNPQKELVQSNYLGYVPRYAAGPCSYAASLTTCRFDALDFKRINGKLVEVIVAYGRYWEIPDGSDVPLPNAAGIELKQVARYNQ